MICYKTIIPALSKKLSREKYHFLLDFEVEAKTNNE